MTWVKVCGLTRSVDVEAAVSAGADAVGFVLSADSPRRVTVAEAAALADGVPVTTVLVTVDMEPDRLLDAVSEAGARGVQPHGRFSDDAAEVASAAGLLVLHPVRVGEGAIDVSAVAPSSIPLLDTADARRHGGTGRTFDWSRARSIGRNVVIAGGLGPANVALAVATAKPWGVDASSRLEVEAGIKDHGKVAAFIEEAKRT